MKSQMKAAGRSGARVAVIVGDDEVAGDTATVRDLAHGEQDVVPRDQVVARARKIVETPAADGETTDSTEAE
jgi:histidyl-tRNA synthetase